MSVHVFQKHVCRCLLVLDFFGTTLHGVCMVWTLGKQQFCIAFVSFCMVLLLLWNCTPGFHTEFCMQLATCCLDNCFEKSGISTVSTLAQGLHNDVFVFAPSLCCFEALPLDVACSLKCSLNCNLEIQVTLSDGDMDQQNLICKKKHRTKKIGG